MKKTNAMRILERLNITFESREYDVSDGLIDGIHVAEKVGLPYESVFKTLVCHQGPELFVFMIPVHHTLDLKKAARAAGVKTVSMLPQQELKNKTGYIHGGCSPLGMKKLLPAFLDQSALNRPHIAVSAGQIGLQVVLAPRDLMRAAEAKAADLTAE